MKYTVNAIADRRTVTHLTVNATSRAMAMQTAADRLTADNVAFDRLTIVNTAPDAVQVRPTAQTVRPSGAVNAYFARVTTSPTADELKANPDAVPVVDDSVVYAGSLSAAYAATADRLTADNVRARCYLIPDEKTAYAAAVDVVRGVTTTLVKYRCRPMDYRLYVAAHKAADKVDDADVLDMIGCAAVGIAEGLATHDDVPAMYDRAYAAVNQYVRAMRGGTSISLEIIRDALTATRRNVRELLGLTRGDASAVDHTDVDRLTAPAADAHIDALTDDLIDSDLVKRLVACLTPKQTCVLDLYMRGKSVRDICKATGVKSPNAIMDHIRAIRRHAAELIDAPAYADRAATLTAATAAADRADAAAVDALIAYSDAARDAAHRAAAAAGQTAHVAAAHHPHWTTADRRAAARRTIDAAAAVLTQYAAAVSTADHQTVNAAREAAAAADRAAQTARLDAIRLRRAADRTRLDVRARADRAAMAGLTAAAAADRAMTAARILTGYRRLLDIAAQTAADAHAAARIAVRADRCRAAHAAAQTAARAAHCARMTAARAAAVARDLDAAVTAARAAAVDLDAVALNARAALADAARTGYRANDAQTAAAAAADARSARRRAAAAAAVPADAAQTAAVVRAHARLARDLITRR